MPFDPAQGLGSPQRSGWNFCLVGSIIPCMRRWLILVLIILMPIRAWAGDVMAVEKAGSALAGAPASSAEMGRAHGVQATSTGTDAHADCHGHAGLAGDLDETAGQAPGAAEHEASTCKVCSACQICHTLALTADLVESAATAARFGLMPARSMHFVSASLARGFKPPIF